MEDTIRSIPSAPYTCIQCGNTDQNKIKILTEPWAAGRKWIGLECTVCGKKVVFREP